MAPAPSDILMVAERAVCQAANELRADMGIQRSEIMGEITGVKNELQGGLDSFREMVQHAFEQNNTMLRGEVDKMNEAVAMDLKTQLKEIQ